MYTEILRLLEKASAEQLYQVLQLLRNITRA